MREGEQVVLEIARDFIGLLLCIGITLLLVFFLPGVL